MKRKLLKRGSAILSVIVLCAILLASIPALLFITAAAADAALDLSVAFSDSYAAVGKELHTEATGVGFSTATYQWTVDGEVVGTSASYTPTADDLMKWITVTITCDGKTATAEMFFSELPVVYINTENGAEIVSKEDYIDAKLIIQGNETYNSKTITLYSGTTEIRGRGNSTWVLPKKPYRLKLSKGADLFGMGKSKHWVLLANYLDESLMRNTLAYDLSGSMGMEQTSTVYVDVVLNGKFVGNYQFCENIRVDTNRVDIFDWETFAEDCAGVIGDAHDMTKSETGDLEEYMAENMAWITSGSFTFNGTTYSLADYPQIEIPSINGGYILELDEYYDEVSKFKTDSSQPIMFKNPEFVNTNSDMLGFVQDYVQAFEDAVQSDTYTTTYEKETVHYSELFDMDSLVDYWLISEIFFNEEINKKSTYMYKDIDGLMKMGPIWDMDWSSGGEGETYITNQWATIHYSTNAQASQWYKDLIQDPYFIVKAQERYWEIRNAQVADMLAELESNYALLKTSAEANGDLWGYTESYDDYVSNLRTWLTTHLSWMDTQMATQDSLQTSLGYHASSNLKLTLTDTLGSALAADTAEKAPADGVISDGESLTLTIQSQNGLSGTAVVYVNSIRTTEVSLGKNAAASVAIPADALTASSGEKDVIEVKIESDGKISGCCFVTVLEN